MKLFIHDWSFGIEAHNNEIPVEADKEYPINAWIELRGERLYLLSVYLFKKCVMFLYVYERKGVQQHISPFPTSTEAMNKWTNKDMILSRSTKGLNEIFTYNINHMSDLGGGGNDCFPEYAQEEFAYLCDQTKDRLPEELQDTEILFRKFTINLESPLTELEHIAIYPPAHIYKTQLADKTFTVPYGKCNIKVPYSIGGEESYIIIKELKIHDLLEDFDKNYSKFEESYKNSLEEAEKNGLPSGQSIMSLDEIRTHYDKRLLMLCLLKPEEHRSFEIHTTEYLNTSVLASRRDSASFFTWAIDKDDNMQDGLYKYYHPLDEIKESPYSEYELTLMFATDSTKLEQKPIFEKTL